MMKTKWYFFVEKEGLLFKNLFRFESYDFGFDSASARRVVNNENLVVRKFDHAGISAFRLAAVENFDQIGPCFSAVKRINHRNCFSADAGAPVEPAERADDNAVFKFKKFRSVRYKADTFVRRPGFAGVFLNSLDKIAFLART